MLCASHRLYHFLIFFVMHALRIDPGGKGEKHGEAWRRSGTAGRRGGRRRRRRRGGYDYDYAQYYLMMSFCPGEAVVVVVVNVVNR